MTISIRGAREHNLDSVDVDIPGGITIVTGVSGSGKSSLIFDVLHHEIRRRFLEVFGRISSATRLLPAKVDSVVGSGPAIAIKQNLLNRNPLSTLATACGLHPFLRLLYARYGALECPRCRTPVTVTNEEEVIAALSRIKSGPAFFLSAPLVRQQKGSHKTLLNSLSSLFEQDQILVDKKPWQGQPMNAGKPHDVDIRLAQINNSLSIKDLREIINTVKALGCRAVIADRTIMRPQRIFSFSSLCFTCSLPVDPPESSDFHRACPFCTGRGCERCLNTGLPPRAAAVCFENLLFPGLLELSVSAAANFFKQETTLPAGAARLKQEIDRRLAALETVGLDYIALNRPAPTLSRGESQRVRLAVSLTGNLEDIVHLLDEPTIGLHPADLSKILPAFRRLKGPVIFVEHDRIAGAGADYALDIGPGAGPKGGQVIFTGPVKQLWKADTATGCYFSSRKRVTAPPVRGKPTSWLKLKKATLRNLKGIDVDLPLQRLTVVSGVSGSGKTTLIRDVLVASLNRGKATGCESLAGPAMKAVMVDQNPIGRNPRSNPATYTKLANLFRDLFAAATDLSASHFSFNRPEGYCPECKGLGAVEQTMRYLSSIWITCTACAGQRFSPEVLNCKISLQGKTYSIADIYALSVNELIPLLTTDAFLPPGKQAAALKILKALQDIGLGYLSPGQPSPTLSGGEAQRTKLARYLAGTSLSGQLLILDEPSTGLHPADINGLLYILDQLVRGGATIVVIEHNPDIIQAADWIIDLGPGAGPGGGELIFAGPYRQFIHHSTSLTAACLKDDASRLPGKKRIPVYKSSDFIKIKNARVNNLKGISVSIPKKSLVVVTGVSGSGKSSLISDILESEARRRFLETMSMYERQSVKEGPEAAVEAVTGLGVTAIAGSGRRRYNYRDTIGSATEIAHHLAVLFSCLGKQYCHKCHAGMQKKHDYWYCPACDTRLPERNVRDFSPRTYAAACSVCHGIGSLQVPAPEKLIINPGKPLCRGAMYSPGFFPKGYLCQEFNGGYYHLRAMGNHFGFDPETTPWNKMTKKAQQAFLYGAEIILDYTTYNKKGDSRREKQRAWGFYDAIRDWDIGGTYTNKQVCRHCGGGQLKPEYLAVKIKNKNIFQYKEMPLAEMAAMLATLSPEKRKGVFVGVSYRKIIERLHFLEKVGLGYLNLNRIQATLSAGEAQRVNLAALLGSGLTALTVICDEPSRGMHPMEVTALLAALKGLRDEGNTVIVVEHDPAIIREADYVIDMGPGAGTSGGRIVARGKPSALKKSITALWLRGERQLGLNRIRKKTSRWLELCGARENNLQNVDLKIPLGCLVGICGVSGSGKSTLLVDTLGRILSPVKQTTSVAYEPLRPGEYSSLKEKPSYAVIVDQSKHGIYSPMEYLGLEKTLINLYAASEEAQAVGMQEKQFKRACSVCRGSGQIKTDMEFLPPVYSPCDACRGTGSLPEAWEVKIKGKSLPALFSCTLEEVFNLFGELKNLGPKLKSALDVGLGYLVLKQPGYTLSGGEAQRIKMARQLAGKSKQSVFYILDEPTYGLHMEDVKRLIDILKYLAANEHTVVVIEHHAGLLAGCDWLIELGPGGGPGGGRIIAEGPPEKFREIKTPTAPYILAALEEEA